MLGMERTLWIVCPQQAKQISDYPGTFLLSLGIPQEGVQGEPPVTAQAFIGNQSSSHDTMLPLKSLICK
jgi:hypothetical protein